MGGAGGAVTIALVPAFTSCVVGAGGAGGNNNGSGSAGGAGAAGVVLVYW
jgi:hypothetical protein